ncbi:arginine-ornithine antiporter [Spirochaetia bacterium]|nr:arginine-ornithine antiporter [Spirochaetia bacterium]
MSSSGLTNSKEKFVGLAGLTALVVGSMIGSGIFDLPRSMDQGAGGLALLLAWLIIAAGMICLGMSFLRLNQGRPEMEGGVFSYAREGFGEYLGFSSAWAYWISALLGNVAYAAVLMSSIQYFWPAAWPGLSSNASLQMGGVVFASVLLWMVHYLILRGVKGATLVNLVVTIAKFVPLLVFAVVVIFLFNIKKFNFSWLGGLDSPVMWGEGGLLEQIRGTMMAAVWSFIGIEGAVVFSGRAKKTADVGKATLIGLIGVIVIYMLLTIGTLGVMSQADIATMGEPSTAFILEALIGPVGAVIMNIGLIVSVLGAWLGWTLLAAEVPMLAAEQGLFPAIFAKRNKNDAATWSVLVSNLIVQVFIVLVYFTTKAYEFGYTMASSAILIPYMFSAFFMVKYALSKPDLPSRISSIIFGVVASVYSIWLFYGAGLDYMAFTLFLFVPGLVMFIAHQRKLGKPIMKVREWIIAVIVSAVGIYGLIKVITGSLELFG